MNPVEPPQQPTMVPAKGPQSANHSVRRKTGGLFWKLLGSVIAILLLLWYIGVVDMVLESFNSQDDISKDDSDHFSIVRPEGAPAVQAYTGSLYASFINFGDDKAIIGSVTLTTAEGNVCPTNINLPLELAAGDTFIVVASDCKTSDAIRGRPFKVKFKVEGNSTLRSRTNSIAQGWNQEVDNAKNSEGSGVDNEVVPFMSVGTLRGTYS
jgi:hypothetical protein